jgi:hypothetical protein
MSLLHCSWKEAEEIRTDSILYDLLDLEALKEKAEKVLDPPFFKKEEAVRFERSFKGIKKGTSLNRRFYDYFHMERGFRENDVRDVWKTYDLKYTLSGRFKHRVIFPFFYSGRLMGWTSRSIVSSSAKYKAFPSGKEAKRYLFNYDQAAQGGHFLVITEGTFDAIKLDFYGRDHGLRSVAILSTSATDPQIAQILRLSEAFEAVVICLDRGADSAALRLRERLFLIDPGIVFLRKPKDPGALTPSGVGTFLTTKLERWR